MEKQKNIPALRFAEFKEEWDMKYGNSVFKVISNKNHNSDLPILAISQEFGAVPREMINYKVSVTDRSVESYKVIEIGDFIISLRSFQGGIEYSNYLGICSPAYIVLRPFIEISNTFFKYFFKTDNYISLLCKKLEGIRDGKMISYKYFSEILLPFPNLQEQTKIATFLNVLDKKLQALKQKKSLLEQYKNGVIQQIFSKELRFKDEKGNDFPDWNKMKLGDLTFKVDKKNKEKIKYPIYSINNKEGFLPQSDQFEGMDSNERGYDIGLYKIIETNTFAYNPARINVGSIGFSGELSKVIISSLYVCFKTIDLLEDSYLLHYLNTKDFNKSVNAVQEGGVRLYLFYDNFSKITIPLPSNQEQTKIAKFLSAIDEKINSNEIQIKQAEQWKKGLLQKMFV
jgi:type I restriction enzyme S subunit